MFLSSMTTDAAAQHGHEFSPPRSASPIPRSIPLHRSALNAVLSAVSFQRNQAPVAYGKELEAGNEQRPTLVQEPDTLSQISDEILPSRPSSSAASADFEEAQRKVRQPRSKTIFNLAHPPPAPRNKQKLQVRPRVLLQLHKVGHGSRPKPQYEVIPSMRCPAKFTRKFGRIFKAVNRLGPDDIVVMKADSYVSLDDSVNSDDDQQAGEPIGVVCVSKSQDGTSRIEICMDDNSVWEATCMRNGNYEFRTIDEHGLEVKVRWVKRLPKRRVSTQSLSRTMALAPEEKKFNFSTIAADTRRHPVCASLIPSRLDILDQYSIPARSPSATPLATPLSEQDSYLDSQASTTGETVQTGEVLRKLIIVTGIFVAFRENWSTAFRYSPEASSVLSSPESPTGRSNPVHARTFSTPISDTASILSSTSSEENRRGTLPRLFRSRTGSLRSRPTISTTTPNAPSRVPTGINIQPTRRSNSVSSTGSAGSVYLQRASSKRQRKRASLPPDLAEADEEGSNSDKENHSHSNASRSQSLLNTPRIVIPPSIPAANEEDEDDDEKKTRGSLSNSPLTPASHKNNIPRVQSAYLLPESTRNLWDSGDSQEPCKPFKPKQRPTSMMPLGGGNDSDTKLKKVGSIRRMFGLFKRDSKSKV